MNTLITNARLLWFEIPFFGYFLVNFIDLNLLKIKTLTTMKKEAFPNEIFVRYECHVVKYIVNENEPTGGGKYYHIAERPQSQHVHFENTLYFKGNVPETITVFRSERNALNAAGYYAQSKVNEIENRIKKLA